MKRNFLLGLLFVGGFMYSAEEQKITTFEALTQTMARAMRNGECIAFCGRPLSQDKLQELIQKCSRSCNRENNDGKNFVLFAHNNEAPEPGRGSGENEWVSIKKYNVKNNKFDNERFLDKNSYKVDHGCLAAVYCLHQNALRIDVNKHEKDLDFLYEEHQSKNLPLILFVDPEEYFDQGHLVGDRWICGKVDKGLKKITYEVQKDNHDQDYRKGVMGGFDGTQCDFTALNRVGYTVLICGVGICALGYWFFFLRNKATVV